MIILAVLAAMILGFLTKRVMIPSAIHYIAYRPPDHPQSMRERNPPTTSQDDGDAANGASGGSEQLTPNDRHQLDAIIKRKTR
jgi:hypothetical protein